METRWRSSTPGWICGNTTEGFSIAGNPHQRMDKSGGVCVVACTCGAAGVEGASPRIGSQPHRVHHPRNGRLDFDLSGVHAGDYAGAQTPSAAGIDSLPANDGAVRFFLRLPALL